MKLKDILQFCTPHTALAATVMVVRSDGTFASMTPSLVPVTILEDPRHIFTHSPSTPLLKFRLPGDDFSMVLNAGGVMAAQPALNPGWIRLRTLAGLELDMKFHALTPIARDLDQQERACPLNNALHLFIQAYQDEATRPMEAQNPMTVQSIMITAHEEAATAEIAC